MEKFKSILILAIIFVLVVLAGYWAISTIESGSGHDYSQEIKKLQDENKALKVQVDSLLSQIPEENTEEEDQEVVTPPETGTTVATSKYQSLINDLQKLVDNKVVLKKGSKGPSVGTVQEFLNVYNHTTQKPDNDYGATTMAAVKKFETAEKLIVTEQIGPNTFKVMIAWLEKQ